MRSSSSFTTAGSSPFRSPPHHPRQALHAGLALHHPAHHAMAHQHFSGSHTMTCLAAHPYPRAQGLELLPLLLTEHGTPLLEHLDPGDPQVPELLLLFRREFELVPDRKDLTDEGPLEAAPTHHHSRAHARPGVAT